MIGGIRKIISITSLSIGSNIELSIIGTINTMEKTIETARILRKDYGYDDYIHLKIIPGASKDSIKRAITTTKDYNKDILKRLDWMNQIAKRNPTFAKSGHTTQLIVGANDETDLEILKRMESLYKKVDLRRSYFSAFSPVEGTEFEKKESCNTDRTAKLYHADALLSDYKFDVKELVFDDDDKLFLNEDPKILAAREMDIFPVEINHAPYKQLIRVPGIGPKSARKIITIRKNKPFKKMEELQILGVVVKRAEPYIKLDGNYQSALDNYQ